jgi:hypothetical protein
MTATGLVASENFNKVRVRRSEVELASSECVDIHWFATYAFNQLKQIKNLQRVSS